MTNPTSLHDAPKEQCPKTGLRPWKHGEKQEPHPCPYLAEVGDDSATLCECCARCTQECADDI